MLWPKPSHACEHGQRTIPCMWTQAFTIKYLEKPKLLVNLSLSYFKLFAALFEPSERDQFTLKPEILCVNFLLLIHLIFKLPLKFLNLMMPKCKGQGLDERRAKVKYEWNRTNCRKLININTLVNISFIYSFIFFFKLLLLYKALNSPSLIFAP